MSVLPRWRRSPSNLRYCGRLTRFRMATDRKPRCESLSNMLGNKDTGFELFWERKVASLYVAPLL